MAVPKGHSVVMTTEFRTCTLPKNSFTTDTLTDEIEVEITKPPKADSSFAKHILAAIEKAIEEYEVGDNW